MSIGLAGAFPDVKGVVSVGEQFEGGTLAELFDDLLKEFQFGELIAVALQEEHGDLDLEKMLGPFLRGATGRVQRESQEDEAAN